MIKEQDLKKNMIWNAVGNLSYLVAQWLVTVLVTRMFLLEGAGILSIAMSLSALFQTVAFFGIRNFQVSDVKEKYSDGTYFRLRHITSLFSFLFVLVAAVLFGYRGETFYATLLFMLFRIFESYADVLHGICQRHGRLYLAGIGFLLKAGALLLGFFLGWFFGKTLLLSLFGMLLGSLLSTLLFDLPQAKRLAEGRLFSSCGLFPLLKETLPLCLYLFLQSAITPLPKLVLGELCGNEVLGAYASIFAPALLLAGMAGYLYTPFIPTFSRLAGEGKERDFRLLCGKIVGVLLCLLLLLLGGGALFGRWALRLVFGESILPFANLLSLILVGIFATAILAFFSMLAVVRRRFLPLCLCEAVGAALSVALSFPFIRAVGANGASLALLTASLAASLLLLPTVFRGGVKEKEKPMQNQAPTHTQDEHTFALCAYKESPFLEECLLSLLNQTVKSRVFISTATPSAYIDGIAEKYGVPVLVNHGEAGITGDWNFAMSHVKTPYFTIAHQDDVYEPHFTERTLAALKKGNGILSFTDYFEIRDGKRETKTALLRVKRLLSLPIKFFRGSRFMRRRVLSLGNAICCPSVTYVRERMKDFRFDGRYAFVCDWDAFERLSKQKGRFYRIGDALMGHRIHEESATTALTNSPRRAEEEMEMFRRFYPLWLAKLIFRFYRKSANSNTLTE